MVCSFLLESKLSPGQMLLVRSNPTPSLPFLRRYHFLFILHFFSLLFPSERFLVSFASLFFGPWFLASSNPCYFADGKLTCSCRKTYHNGVRVSRFADLWRVCFRVHHSVCVHLPRCQAAPYMVQLWHILDCVSHFLFVNVPCRSAMGEADEGLVHRASRNDLCRSVFVSVAIF